MYSYPSVQWGCKQVPDVHMKFKAMCTAKGFSKALDYQAIDPDLPDDPSNLSNDLDEKKAEKAAIARNNKAVAAFVMSLTKEELMVYITRSQTHQNYPDGLAYLIHQRLHERYAPNDRVARVEALSDLRNVKFDKGDTPDEFVGKLVACQTRYAKLNVITDEMLIDEILVKIPERYQATVANVVGDGTATIVEALRAGMMNLHRMISNHMDKDDDEEAEEPILMSSYGRKNGLENIRCYNCNQMGHKAADCHK